MIKTYKQWLVTYNQAKTLKSLGYNEPTPYIYDINGNLLKTTTDEHINSDTSEYVSAVYLPDAVNFLISKYQLTAYALPAFSPYGKVRYYPGLIFGTWNESYENVEETEYRPALSRALDYAFMYLDKFDALDKLLEQNRDDLCCDIIGKSIYEQMKEAIKKLDKVILRNYISAYQLELPEEITKFDFEK